MLDTLLSLEFVDHTAEEGQRPGVEGIKLVWQELWDAYPDIEVKLEDLYDTSGQVAGREWPMSKTSLARVLVVGGTGHYGQHVVGSLAQRGAPVRVLSQNAASARSLLGEGLDIVEGDVTSKTARRTALQGMDALVISVSAMAPALIR